MGQLRQKVLRLLKDKNYLKCNYNKLFGDCISYDQYRRFSTEDFREMVNLKLWTSILDKHITKAIKINMDVPQKEYDEVFKFLDAHQFLWGNGDSVYSFLDYFTKNSLGVIKTLHINQHTLRLTWGSYPIPNALSPKEFISKMEALEEELNARADELINI